MIIQNTIINKYLFLDDDKQKTFVVSDNCLREIFAAFNLRHYWRSDDSRTDHQSHVYWCHEPLLHVPMDQYVVGHSCSGISLILTFIRLKRQLICYLIFSLSRVEKHSHASWRLDSLTNYILSVWLPDYQILLHYTNISNKDCCLHIFI